MGDFEVFAATAFPHQLSMLFELLNTVFFIVCTLLACLLKQLWLGISHYRGMIDFAAQGCYAQGSTEHNFAGGSSGKDKERLMSSLTLSLWIPSQAMCGLLGDE